MQCLKFNKDWIFEKTDSNSQLRAFQGKSNAVKINLPYDAMIREKRSADCPAGAQSGFYPGGNYSYEKEFFAPEDWSGKDVFLEFEGVYGRVKVWVNGSLAGINRNGYMEFIIDLKPWIFCGQNNIVKVEVDNSCQPNSRWYTGSGIYRDVNLLIGTDLYVPRNGLRITTLSVQDKVAVIEVCGDIKNITGIGTEAECEIELCSKGNIVAKKRQHVVFQKNNEETFRVQMPIIDPEKWGPDYPYLYQCKVQIKQGDKICDVVNEHFGVRILSLDPINGFRINGETINLRGACIHHDNGIIGAETFPEAEWYRCKRLKEAGFNALRSSHHPMSRAMLDACDRLGMLVMDELTDMWNRHKNPYDYADIFQDEAKQWIGHMIAKDYNHPSVVMYSVGNEIQEAGTKQGAWINRYLCNKIHELDATRYTTNALNGLNCAGKRLKEIMRDVVERFGMDPQGGGNGGGSNALNSFMSLMSGEKGDFFATHPLVSEALEECSQSCDVIGLNYLRGRYLLEHKLHPGKTVLGTETYPADIENLWALVEENSHIIGDFTWAGYDYIGEAGVGIFHYDGNENFTSVYPERLGYIGDLDLIGNRRPISYFREIVYGLTDQPYIAVERMEHAGEVPSKTAWMFRDVISSWTWNGFEEQTAKIEVYSSGDEVELFLNAASLGKKATGKSHHFNAEYEVPYKPGTLRAVAYRKGVVIGEYKLMTAGQVKKLKAEQVTEQENELVYVKVWMEDEKGCINHQEVRNIHVQISGNGILEGYGTANPADEEDYFSADAMTFDGYVMLAVRKKLQDSEEPVDICFSAEGCEKTEIRIGW